LLEVTIVDRGRAPEIAGTQIIAYDDLDDQKGGMHRLADIHVGK
jgi:hypothetical protein